MLSSILQFFRPALSDNQFENQFSVFLRVGVLHRFYCIQGFGADLLLYMLALLVPDFSFYTLSLLSKLLTSGLSNNAWVKVFRIIPELRVCEYFKHQLLVKE